jgi:hypothetical protein
MTSFSRQDLIKWKNKKHTIIGNASICHFLKFDFDHLNYEKVYTKCPSFGAS